MMGLVEVQLGGREVTAGRNWFTIAVNLDPKRKEGARMKMLPAKKMAASKRVRIRGRIARLEVEQAHRLIYRCSIETSAVNKLTCLSTEQIHGHCGLVDGAACADKASKRQARDNAGCRSEAVRPNLSRTVTPLDIGKWFAIKY